MKNFILTMCLTAMFAFLGFNYVSPILDNTFYSTNTAYAQASPKDERNVEEACPDPEKKRIICKTGKIDCTPKNCPDPAQQ